MYLQGFKVAPPRWLWLNTGMTAQYPDNNPYDFIMNPASPPPKKPLGLGGKNAFFVKIGLIVGGVVIAMIAIAVVINMLTGSKTNTADLLDIAQTQQEIIRISAQASGGSGARDQSLKNFAKNTELSVTTQQLKTLSYLASQNVKPKSKELSIKQNAETTKQLANALQTSTFDSAYRQIIQTSLDSYSSDLQKYYNNSSNTTVRGLLKQDYEQAQLLKAQLPTSTSSPNTQTTTTP
jgi:hypothetical protein